VKDALDLCLGCKACINECPVQVDMASYKAEFLAHYYEKHWRPRRAHFIGRIDRWSRLASRMPRLSNLALQTPGLRSVAARAVGIDPRRRFPRYARQTFRRWFEGEHRHEPVGKPDTVLLWPDTFNDNFHPETGKAAVATLRAAGFTPKIPATPMCCGRPLYDFGLLDEARERLRDIVRRLRDDIASGTPVLFLEPSCLSVFRHELGDLLPDDPDAERLSSQCVSFAEFMERHCERLEWAPLARRGIYHGHCHQKALFGTERSERLLDAAGLQTEVLDAGCCGMAGSFGFEHFDLSRRIGARVLFPAVEAAAPDTLIVTEGFSCREQLRQMTGRRALHLADVLAMAVTPPSEERTP
jgi:Fe-S oxidoreductase